LLGCEEKRPSPQSPKKPRSDIVVLATGGESLDADGGVEGAGRLLASWKTNEGHAVEGAGNTLLVSTGGHLGGAAGRVQLSWVLSRMGYSASAASSSDLSQGREALRADASRLPYVIANLNDPDLAIGRRVEVERGGIVFQVVGVSSGGPQGLALTPAEEQLSEMWTLWRGDRPMILVTDLCIQELAQILDRTKQWPFMFLAIGRRCGSSESVLRVNAALVMASGDGFGEYGRAVLTFDRNTAALLRAEARLAAVDAGLPDVDLVSLFGPEGQK